jgi:hypothetical protein
MLSTLRSIGQSTNLTLFHLNCSLIAALLGLATYRLFIKGKLITNSGGMMIRIFIVFLFGSN